jgi:type IV pilus assembly protein PilA
MAGPRGFSLVELLMVVALVAIVLAVAIPGYLGARRAGDEATALSTLETVNTAQAAFKAICGNGRYAPDLPALGMPVPATGESFLSADLTSGTQVKKAGYVIQMVGEPVADAPAACNGAAVAAGYAATADPVLSPGARFFGTNASGAIYEHSETLTGTMPESGPAPAGREIGHD